MASEISDGHSMSSPHSLKQIVRAFLSLKYVNSMVVSVLSLLPAYEWKQRIPVVGREVILDLGDEVEIKMGRTDRCQIAQEIFWNCGNLRSPADRLAVRIATSFAREATVFLDIGAYTGMFALAAGRVNSSIRSYAYEIVPENFLTLYSNVFLNNLALCVEPRLCGISNMTGTLTMPASALRGVLPSSLALDWKFEEGVDVRLQTLDELHSDIDGPVVIKIDVEGFETEVLEGGRNLLERTKPDIICEVLRRAPRISDLEALMRSFGYRFYHISDLGLVERESIEPKKTERDWFLTVRGPDEIQKMGIKFVEGA